MKVFAFLLVVTFGFLASKAHAQADSPMGLDNVEAVLQDILEQQNVSTVQELDLAKVSDDEWERLGDTVMELQHPGEAHKAMDRMMGGEGSESLRQMHINMGQAYLGYGSNNYGQGMMMGGGMMGYSAFGGYSILGTATWILVIVFLASGTYFFLRKAHKK